jgi:hypothetical protein
MINQKFNLVGSRNELQYLKIKNLTSSSIIIIDEAKILVATVVWHVLLYKSLKFKFVATEKNFMFELNLTQFKGQKSICPNPVPLQPFAWDKTQPDSSL